MADEFTEPEWAVRVWHELGDAERGRAVERGVAWAAGCAIKKEIERSGRGTPTMCGRPFSKQEMVDALLELYRKEFTFHAMRKFYAKASKGSVRPDVHQDWLKGFIKRVVSAASRTPALAWSRRQSVEDRDLDGVAARVDAEKALIARELLQRLWAATTEEDRELLLDADAYDRTELAEKYGCNVRRITKRVSRVRARARRAVGA